MGSGPKIPGVDDLLWPVLKAVGELGGSALRAEILEHARTGFTEEQIGVLASDGQPVVLNRAGWAIHRLKILGALENSERGVYATTPQANTYLRMNDDAAGGAALKRAVKKAIAAKVAKRKQEDEAEAGAAVEDETEPSSAPGDDWRTVLLEVMKKMDPAAFERLAKRLLREAGFQKVDVVGRAGDGGIDGLGLYKMSLVSFPIYFQCKRYAGSVGASIVRDFRGAMAGRGDKGLLITTGTFTPTAREEATRDGAPPVDLIDGDELCDLILEYRLGVNVTERTVKEVAVDEAFFANV